MALSILREYFMLKETILTIAEFAVGDWAAKSEAYLGLCGLLKLLPKLRIWQPVALNRIKRSKIKFGIQSILSSVLVL